jgi:serine/threonine-protein kinase
MLLIQSTCIAAFYLARSLRQSSLRSLEKLDQAIRGIAQREALLAEARAEMEEVAQIGGPGRYTDQLVGGYRLGVVIGRGAMGEVYEASHEETGRIAAAKLLHPRSLTDRSTVERFLRELRIAASLDVPNVVEVLEIPEPNAPIPYLIMERLRGDSLADVLRESPRLPAREVAAIVREVGRGLRAAHAAGIVHRDLKPHNLFRHQPADGRPVWKVLDFGVSKLMDQSGTLTQGAVVGTPGYMAPEQARGEEVDARCDLYGLGAICYRALTGRPPFSGSDVPTLLYAVVYDMPPRPSSVAPLPAAFDDVLAVAIAKPADRRFADPDQLADAIEAAADDRIDGDLRSRAATLRVDNPWQ